MCRAPATSRWIACHRAAWKVISAKSMCSGSKGSPVCGTGIRIPIQMTNPTIIFATALSQDMSIITSNTEGAPVPAAR